MSSLENLIITEEFRVDSGAVDRSRGVIRNVKLVGFNSKNGRTYTPESLQRAVSKYEGAKVNIDHPPVNEPQKLRSVADRFGTIRGARFVEGKGVFGDLHFNPKHSLAEQVMWAAENDPSSLGFSHNSSVRMGRGNTVEEVVNIRSVDLVADPATTDGVFESATESRREETIQNRSSEDWLRKIQGQETEAEKQQRNSDAEPWTKRILGQR